MIDKVIWFSIQNKLVVALLVTILVGLGIYSAYHLPVDAVPDITDNQVQVITTSPSLAAQEVEQQITYPLEISMANIPGVESIRSVSRFGLSVITVVFEESFDVYLARQLISERIKLAENEIPPGIGKPEMGPISTGLGEIYQYVLHPKPGYDSLYTPTDLRTIQDWIVRRQLSGIKGVVEVNSSGGYLKQYEVAVDPEKLRTLELSIQDVFNALERNNQNTGGAYIEKQRYSYFVRGEGRLKDKTEIERVVVGYTGGVPVLLKEIGTVTIGHAPRFGAVTMDGKGEVVAGQVMMLKGANSAEVTERVKERLDQIKSSLPEGITLEPYLDRSELVNRTTKTVVTNLVEGGLIVIFVLVLLLGNFRAGLIVASVIPLAMLFALSMMYVFGVSANLMSLGAIDFGIIVDGAVIVIESIVHQLYGKTGRMKMSQKQMDVEVYSAAAKIRQSAAFGEIIILIVYLPILFLFGIEGKMFKPMAQTVSFAIFGAFLLSLTYVPMMAAMFLKKKADSSKSVSEYLIGFFQKLYTPVLNLAIRKRRAVVIATFLLFAFSFFVFFRMGGEFIPTLEEGDLALHQILPPGSSISQSVEVSKHLQVILLEEFPEVEKVVTKIGTAEIPTDIMPMEAGDIFVSLKEKSEWTSASTLNELFERMEEALNQYPGVIYEFTQPIQMRFNELMTGIRQDIAIKIYGEDLGALSQYGKQAKDIIKNIPGVGEVQLEQTAGLPQLAVVYNRDNMARYGVDAEQINQVVSASFAGAKTGIIFEGEKRFDLVVRLDKKFRNNIEHLKNLYVPTSGGQQILLNNLAMVSLREGPVQISRDDTKRRITLGVNARNRDVESLVEEIRNRLSENLPLPPAYYITYGGQFENLNKAKERLSVAVPIALLMILVLLYFTFNSAVQALLIFTAVPLASIGGVFALYLRDMPFSISAGVGFIALFGVAVLNGIVLIASFNQLKKNGMKNVLRRIKTGTSIRLRPVIMTAAVASLGFLPMAISTSAGAEVQQPLATVVIGGLFSATFLTLILLPVLYYSIEKRRRRGRSHIPLLIIGCFLGLSPNEGTAQSPKISLEAAVERTYSSFPTLKMDSLAWKKQKVMENATPANLPTSFYFGGEELDFSPDQGVYSLGGAQRFYLPRVNKDLIQLMEAKSRLAEVQILITRNQLKYEISVAYLDLVFEKNKAILLQKLWDTYNAIENTEMQKLSTGESGKIPLLSAAAKKKNIEWLQIQNKMEQTARQHSFNFMMQSDTLFDAEWDTLPYPLVTTTTKHADAHPLLQRRKQEVYVAREQLQSEKNKNLPLLNAGMKMQRVNGNIPFIGYQVGMDVPLLGKKKRNARLEAAHLEIETKDKSYQIARTKLVYQLEILQIEKDKYKLALDYLNNEVIPLLSEKSAAIRQGFMLGDIDYRTFLESINELQEKKMLFLQTLLNYHKAQVKIDYYSGN